MARRELSPTGNDKRSEPEALLRGLDRAIRCVCAIEGAGGKGGTGTLIAPDKVLTNYHVVDKLIGETASFDGAECRFDYRNDASGKLLKTSDPDAVFAIKEILIWSKPSPADRRDGGDQFVDNELDYAILRIDRPAGRENDTRGRKRGWIMLPKPDKLPDPDIGMEICILQHPFEDGGLRELQPLKADIADIIDTRGDHNDRYVHNGATRQGSSGGPCFSTGYEFGFIALHNAGLNDKNDDVGRGQAIPLSRIARDIAKRYPQRNQILGVEPPAETASDIDNQRRAEAIERRRRAALCLMDRSREENRFLARLAAAAANKQVPHPLLHVVVCKQGDAHEFFLERLSHLSLEIRLDALERSRLDALTKGLTAPTRTVQLKAWPQLNDPEQRREDLTDFLILLDANSRYLLLFSRTIDSVWSSATEAALLAEFAAMLAAKFEDNRDNVQAVVFFIVANESDAAVLIPQFGNLWRAGSPDHCGVCVRLSQVGLNDLDEWRSYLNKAWSENPAFQNAIRRQFNGAQLESLDAIAAGLKDSLSSYIAETLDKAG
jgi:hypothetical protein